MHARELAQAATDKLRGNTQSASLKQEESAFTTDYLWFSSR